MGWLTVGLGVLFLAAGVWTGIALADLVRTFTDINDVWDEEEL